MRPVDEVLCAHRLSTNEPLATGLKRSRPQWGGGLMSGRMDEHASELIQAHLCILFCCFHKKTFTTEITARYKLQQQTQISILNTTVKPIKHH